MDTDLRTPVGRLEALKRAIKGDFDRYDRVLGHLKSNFDDEIRRRIRSLIAAQIMLPIRRALAEDPVLRDIIEGPGAITPPGLRALDGWPEAPADARLIRTKAATFPAELVR